MVFTGPSIDSRSGFSKHDDTTTQSQSTYESPGHDFDVAPTRGSRSGPQNGAHQVIARALRTCPGHAYGGAIFVS